MDIIQQLKSFYGIPSLYPPQEDAWTAIDTGKNVLVSIPTSAGKSMAAWMALGRNFIRNGSKGILVVPLKALANEKYDELKQLQDVFGWKVAISTGDYSSNDSYLRTADIVVCTIEKMDNILRTRAAWLDNVGCLVIDEVHMMGNVHRGPTVEMILMRSLFAYSMQIVGLSATLSNDVDFANWFNAKLISSEWRPVKLEVATMTEGRVEYRNGTKLEYNENSEVIDAVLDTVRNDGQVIVFVNTRKETVTQAKRLSAALTTHVRDTEGMLERLSKLRQMEDEQDSTWDTVQDLALCGVGFHNAGLTRQQRKFVEAEFRNRNIRCITATSTLAAGVNTPARRVILKGLQRFDYKSRSYVGIDVGEARQMMGRAGRAGYDAFGDAILMCPDETFKDFAVKTYVDGPSEPVVSHMGVTNNARMQVLSTIVSNYARSLPDLMSFFKGTFNCKVNVSEAISYLETKGFIDYYNGQYNATVMGRKTIDTHIDTDTSEHIRDWFSGSPEFNELSLFIACASFPNTPRMPISKTESDLKAEAMANTPVFPPYLNPNNTLELTRTYKGGAIIKDWVDEVPLNTIKTKYNVSAGDIKALIDSVNWNLSAMSEFAASYNPEWVDGVRLVARRVIYGVEHELLDLVKMRHVGRVKARKLYNAGFLCADDVTIDNIGRISELSGFGLKVAKSIIEDNAPPTMRTTDILGDS